MTGRTVSEVVRLREELDRVRQQLHDAEEARREAELVAEEALARLYEADEARMTFLATISHELRTPLTSIAGFTTLLLRERSRLDDEVAVDLLARIDRNATSLRAMIEDVLDFSRLERGRRSVEPVPGELAPLVQAVLDDQHPNFTDHAVEVDLEPDVRAVFEPEAVRRILVNLLVNATRYSPAGSTIGVRLRSAGAVAELDVVDQGPGIPADERQRVFEPFFRGAHGHVMATHGTGIGLSVVKQLVEQMQGSVEVIDGEPTGSCFRIALPLVDDA